MIAFVAGRVAGIGPDGAVIEVGGVGLHVQCTSVTLAGLRLGESAHLPTSLLVREDSLTLYGFADDDERQVFDLLLSVSGIGPRIAQAMLTVHDPEALRRAVATEDLTALMKVPGIGRKGAQRLVLELKDRLGPPRGTPSAPVLGRPAVAAWQEQVLGALLNLGWSAREAEEAVDKVAVAAAESEDAGDVAAMLKAALKMLGEIVTEPSWPMDPVENLVDAHAALGEQAVEAALRPKRLAEFVGQQRVREQLSLVLEAARLRGRPPDHLLLSGPPGLGKTTLAMIVAAELGMPLRVTSGPAIQHAGDLAALLSSLTEGEVLFLDEIHRMARPAEEMLYMAMEDFRVDVIVGKGAGATAIPLEIPPFTLVGATTRAGLLPGPLRDRFGFTAHMDFYSPEELERVLRRSSSLLDVPLPADGAAEIARRSRGTPRIANRLLRRVRDFAQVRADGVVTRATARDALALYDVDEIGLDRLDRAVLDALLRRFGGGPVGLSTLAVSVGEEPETVEEVAEPFLVRLGLLARTPRGRVATPAAWEHLGLRPPAGAASAFGAGQPLLFGEGNDPALS